MTIFFCYLSLGLQAKSIQDFTHEYLKGNVEIQNNLLQRKSNLLNVDSTLADYGFDITTAIEYDDNKNDFSSSTNSSQIKTQTLSLEISKDWITGTAISFSNDYNKYDRERLTSVSSSDRYLSQFSQELSLTQDLGKNIFGQINKLGLKIVEETANASNATLNAQDDQKILNFYDVYLKLRLAKTNLTLQKEAYKRSKRRRDITSRKVKDGLSEKADLYQAEINLLQKKENVNSAMQGLDEALKNFEKLLHRDVSVDEILEIEMSKVKEIKNPRGEINDNLTIKQIEKLLEVSSIEVESSKKEFFPEIELSLNYNTNDYDQNTSEAFSKGHLAKSQRGINVSVELTMPLGFDEQRVQLEQDKISKLQNEMLLRKQKINLKLTSKIIEDQIRLYLENLKNSVLKISFAKKNLSEHIKLYNLGRIELDRVIDAEETLIQTQTSHIELWTSYLRSLSQSASLYGKLMSFLEEDAL